MNMVDFTKLYETFNGELGSCDSFAIFEKYGLPSRKQEAWRYANIAAWDLHSDLIPPALNVDIAGIDKELLKDVDILSYNGAIIMLKDVPGVSLTRMIDDKSLSKNFDVSEFAEQNSFIAYTIACLNGGFCLKAEKNAKIKILNYKDENVFSNELNLIEVQPGVSLDLCVRYAGGHNSSYWLSSINHIKIAKGAMLNSEFLQNESQNAISQHVNIIVQDAHSSYKQREFACGAKVSRSEYNVMLTASGANADLSGVNYVKKSSWHNTNIVVNHLADHCVSRQNFRSILYDKSTGVFLGHIYVPKGIKGSEAYQDSKNMLLGTFARAIAKPYLEIYADDVVCTHSATVGQLDKNMLFFLLSRGISKNKSKQLLLESFIVEISDNSPFAKDLLHSIDDYNKEQEL